ncbi:MAG: HTH domain-containing protein [Candidatus Doudnabacteria bacterium]|nr:HTH domain-containing protein [Candidatus Doudnabacteria bacterium]
MANNKVSSEELLMDIKQLLMLFIASQGVSSEQIAKTLNVSVRRIQQMIPLKNIKK